MQPKPNTYGWNMTANWVEQSGQDYKIYASNNVAQRLNKSWFEPAFWQENKAVIGESSGRATAYFVDYQELSMVLRRYHRGGLIAKLSADNYVFTGFAKARAAQEFKLLDDM